VLHGIPVTVKDVIDVAGAPTRAGSDAYDIVPTADATGVARLRAAGATVLAKVATHEFALGVTNPQCGNPHDPGRIPGGSSGGSAIAVATGMGLASLGTDTRASIRVPAALSGVVGFKPTYGRVPTDGVVTLSWTMDHVAPMAATVGDAALVMEVLLGHGGLVAACGASVAGLTVGVAEAGFADADTAVADRVHAALAGLARAGARIVDTPHPSPRDLARANAAGMLISRCEATTFHTDLGLDRSLYWDEVAEQLDAADDVRATEYLNAQRVRARLVADLGTAFDHVDLLAMPTSPVLAPPRDEFAEFLMLLARNAIPWSLVGFPALSVPVGTVGSLPVGLQLVAPPDREDLLAAVAHAVERAVA
jgi:aspartyl-tRNA(Asn)/glutamyl-tRNA(Gln) amidotransferase subunit A